MSNRTEQEYRALIRGWRIRLRNHTQNVSSALFREIFDIMDEMEKEVPDYISHPKVRGVETPRE